MSLDWEISRLPEGLMAEWTHREGRSWGPGSLPQARKCHRPDKGDAGCQTQRGCSSYGPTPALCMKESHGPIRRRASKDQKFLRYLGVLFPCYKSLLLLPNLHRVWLAPVALYPHYPAHPSKYSTAQSMFVEWTESPPVSGLPSTPPVFRQTMLPTAFHCKQKLLGGSWWPHPSPLESWVLLEVEGEEELWRCPREVKGMGVVKCLRNFYKTEPQTTSGTDILE